MVTNKYRITRSAGELPALSWVRLAFAFLILSIVLALPSGRGLAQSGPPQEVLEGTVEVLHEDRDPGSRYIYFLQTATERLELQFASNPPALVSGDRIRARGLRTNGVLALTSSTSTQTLSAALPNTFGAQKTLVILVNFQDNATQPYTVASAQSVMGTTSKFDLENSFQQTSLTGVVDVGQAADVRGWYTIAQNSADACNNYYTTANLAEQAAAADGVDVSAYNRRVYAMPDISTCSWWGLGTVGGNPSKAWIDGSFQLKVVGHEMGHNFGLYHSHSLSCASGTCTASEYGDGWDIMGNPSSGHFNAYQKERLGWLDYNVSPPISSVQADGVYWVAPYEAQNLDPKALKILKSTDLTTGKSTYYYVEYRAGLGYDSSLSKAVIVHTGSESSANSTYLWDLDQETTTTDWVLNLGQTYSDATAGVNITLLSMDSTGASVSVTFGGGGGTSTTCVPANPTVAISPTSQWVIGTTGTYMVTITDNDSSACAASSFNLSASVPAGWTAALAPLAALSPGSSTSTSLSLTAPSTTPDGFYNFGVTASNSANSSYSGSASGTEVGFSGILAVKAGTDSGSYMQNSWVTITVNVRVGQSPVSGASVTVNIVKGGATQATLSGVTDANGNVVLSYKLGARAPTGSWQVAASATANGYNGSNNTATFTVTEKSGGGGGGGGPKPR